VIYVILFIITAVASTHWLRFCQARECRMMWVGAWLYITSAACTALGAYAAGRPISVDTANYGLMAGIALGGAYLFFNATIREMGVGIAHLTRQLALSVPILASVLVWRENIAGTRGIGVALVFVALPLMARPLEPLRAGAARWVWFLPAGLFITAGLMNAVIKAYAESASAGNTSGCVLFLLIGAGAVVLMRAVHAGEPLRVKEVFYGAVLGLDNAILNYSRTRAIEICQGIKVFPTMSLGVILLSLTLAFLIWKERYRGRVLAGMLLAILALILIYLRP